MTKTEKEMFWDKRAAMFNKITSKNDQITEDIKKAIDFLKSQNILNPEAFVIDVGCGTGRYSIPFSKYSRKTKGVDLSSQMIKFAEENSKGIDNIEFEKLDWENFDIDSSIMKNKFDLAFANMVPIFNDANSLEKFNKLSKGYCVVNRFIKRKNSLDKILKNNDRRRNPHNDRSYVQNLFNTLWENGYNPNIYYYSIFEEKTVYLEEFVNRFIINDNETIERLKDLSDDKNQINYTVDSELALTYWKTKNN